MRLERHVGGLSLTKKQVYLRECGWEERQGLWCAPVAAAEPCSLSRAVHHQLTVDLCAALARTGWRIGGYTERGYARLVDPKDGSTCALPGALRREARRRGCPVGELTYSFFLAARLTRSGVDT
jgi:hypothetical protein